MDAVEAARPVKVENLDRLTYKFSHRLNGTYFWVLVAGGVPGDPATKIITAPVAWYWNPKGTQND